MTYKQELIYALEAAEITSTNMGMLALLQALQEENVENATQLISTITIKHGLDKNESFHRHMQDIFTYYANISPRPIWATQKMAGLENIWEIVCNH